ncbi:MAG TPA: FAD-binding oxidoreductase, partial [Candidatus Binataceae bacterium]|nr:FAD-binding oxidoreductase [Candidatus Binataceae bacterium]
MDRRDPADLMREIGSLAGCLRAATAAEAPAARIVAEPANPEEIAEIVRKCERDSLSLAPLGAARTLAQLRLEPAAIGISLERMNRIIDYVPDDMTVVAEAGLTLGALNTVAGAHGQRLPCDPAGPDSCTLGAMVAAAKAGPLRLSEGVPRDLLIGVRFVGHGGRLVHGGGRVVKNVAGYDLMKVMTGSFGTLGIITETTFKVRPIPPNYAVAIASFDSAGDAFAAARRAEEAAPLIHLEVVSNLLGGKFDRPGRCVVLAGFGGIRTEADYHRARTSNALRRSPQVLTGSEAAAFYERLRDFDLTEYAIVAQLAVLPAELPRCLRACGGGFIAHAASGVARIFLPDDREPIEIHDAVARWREIAREGRGHLRILSIRDREPNRAGFAMFDQPPEPAMRLMRSLKAT